MGGGDNEGEDGDELEGERWSGTEDCGASESVFATEIDGVCVGVRKDGNTKSRYCLYSVRCRSIIECGEIERVDELKKLCNG